MFLPHDAYSLPHPTANSQSYTEGSFRSIGKVLAVSLEKCEISAILISFIAVFSGALSILDQK